MADREKLIELLDEACPRPYCSVPDMNCDICDYNHPKWHCVDLRVADYLIANDVVPVVRCKDCRHRGEGCCPMYYEEEIEWDDDGYTEVDYVPCDRTMDDGFCDRGERKDNE